VREFIPDAEFVEIADAPHELPRSNPAEVVDALDAFFRDA
jgi:pimeloyl-ACP methyl ester carboxylesterase